MNTNKILIGVAGLIVLVASFLIGRSFGTTTIQQLGGAVSAVGTTNTSAKIFSVNMAPLTAAATTTSVLNPLGLDVAVTSTFAYCTGVGTSQTFRTGAALASDGWSIQMATTSTSGGGLLSNTNYASNLTIATSSAYAFTSSTTDSGGANNNVGRLWPAGTYMSITFNATNTAACTVGGNIIAL